MKTMEWMVSDTYDSCNIESSKIHWSSGCRAIVLNYFVM